MSNVDEILSEYRALVDGCPPLTAPAGVLANHILLLEGASDILAEALREAAAALAVRDAEIASLREQVEKAKKGLPTPSDLAWANEVAAAIETGVPTDDMSEEERAALAETHDALNARILVGTLSDASFLRATAGWMDAKLDATSERVAISARLRSLAAKLSKTEMTDHG